jgi:hypothetical protein
MRKKLLGAFAVAHVCFTRRRCRRPMLADDVASRLASIQALAKADPRPNRTFSASWTRRTADGDAGEVAPRRILSCVVCSEERIGESRGARPTVPSRCDDGVDPADRLLSADEGTRVFPLASAKQTTASISEQQCVHALDDI